MIEQLKRLFRSIVPLVLRAGGGSFVTCAPANAAFKQLTAHATAGISKWGKMVELLAATANTSDGWIEGVHANNYTATSGEFNIAITQETGTGTPTAGLIEAQVPGFLISATDTFLRITPPIYVAAGQRIAAAMAGVATKKVSVVAVISRNR